MARYKLEISKELSFSMDLQVRITEVNYGGHVGNDAVLGLLHEARLRFLDSAGLSEVDVGGAGLIMRDAQLAYHAQMRRGQELRVEVGAADLGGSSFALEYRIRDAESGKALVEARTGMLCFDYERNRPLRMPGVLRDLLQAGG